MITVYWRLVNLLRTLFVLYALIRLCCRVDATSLVMVVFCHLVIVVLAATFLFFGTILSFFDCVASSWLTLSL